MKFICVSGIIGRQRSFEVGDVIDYEKIIVQQGGLFFFEQTVLKDKHFLPTTERELKDLELSFEKLIISVNCDIAPIRFF